MLSDTPEADLVIAARAGDSASFGECVRRYAPRMVRVARQMVGPDRADDMVQEAMVDAWRALGSFAGRSALETWLHRITVNRCLAELRKRRPPVVDVEPMDLLARWEDPDFSVDPETVAIRSSQAEVLRSLLDTLPAGYRNALILHDGQGFSAAEVAELTGIPLGTAKSNIRRGRMALVALLGDETQMSPGVQR
jgi:RNA polymerase sigma-70 factor (ECF subfamily)